MNLIEITWNLNYNEILLYKIVDQFAVDPTFWFWDVSIFLAISSLISNLMTDVKGTGGGTCWSKKKSYFFFIFLRNYVFRFSVIEPKSGCFYMLNFIKNRILI